MIIFAVPFNVNLYTMPEEGKIVIKGARVNNLRNISIEIPRKQFLYQWNRFYPVKDSICLIGIAKPERDKKGVKHFPHLHNTS